MRTKLGAVLIGIGVFSLVLAGLAKFYVYDKVAVAPLDQNASSADGAEDPPSVSIGNDGTIFSVAAGLREIQTDVTSTRNTVGQVTDSEELNDATGENLAIYETFSYSTDSSDIILSGTFDRVIFDRTSGETFDCPDDVADLCDEKTGSTITEETLQQLVEEQGAENPANLQATMDDIELVRAGDEGFDGFEGQYFKMPFNTQKQTYQWWDGSIKQATNMEFVEEEEIEGLTTYKFEQVIPPTDIADQELPASVTGLADDVLADRMYSNTRTLWIEPETGAIIRAQEEQLTTFDYEDEPLITATDVTIGYDEATVENNVDKYSSLALQLKLVRVWVPILGLILGILLIGIGVFLAVSGRDGRDGSAGRRKAQSAPEREPAV